MRLKICENLRTVSINPNLLVLENKKGMQSSTTQCSTGNNIILIQTITSSTLLKRLARMQLCATLMQYLLAVYVIKS